MSSFYQARVETDFGVYRAMMLDGAMIGFTEDGVDGLIDIVEIEEVDQVKSSPEWLLELLCSYVYERRRGETITSATLTRRDA